MAYDVKKLEQEILTVIEREQLTFFTEVSLYTSVSRATLYNLELEKLDSIKDAITANRLKQKAKMRKKWIDSDNATLQISAYRLMADDEEMDKLTLNRVAHSGDLSIKWTETKNYGANDQTNAGS